MWKLGDKKQTLSLSLSLIQHTNQHPHRYKTRPKNIVLEIGEIIKKCCQVKIHSKIYLTFTWNLNRNGELFNSFIHVWISEIQSFYSFSRFRFASNWFEALFYVRQTHTHVHTFFHYEKEMNSNIYIPTFNPANNPLALSFAYFIPLARFVWI